jgi:hypothetical protein
MALCRILTLWCYRGLGASRAFLSALGGDRARTLRGRGTFGMWRSGSGAERRLGGGEGPKCRRISRFHGFQRLGTLGGCWARWFFLWVLVNRYLTGCEVMGQDGDGGTENGRGMACRVDLVWRNIDVPTLAHVGTQVQQKGTSFQSSDLVLMRAIHESRTLASTRSLATTLADGKKQWGGMSPLARPVIHPGERILPRRYDRSLSLFFSFLSPNVRLGFLFSCLYITSAFPTPTPRGRRSSFQISTLRTINLPSELFVWDLSMTSLVLVHP